MRRTRAAGGALLMACALAGCVADPGGPGTRSEPTAVGTTASIGSYDMTLFPTSLDAGPLLAAAAQPGAAPAAGRQLVLVPVQLTYRGETAGDPWSDLDVWYVTRGGAMYGGSEADQCGTVPGAMERVETMAPGTTAWGNVCVAVPADEIEGGTWVARDGGLWGWRGFFAASAEPVTLPGSFVAPTPVGGSIDVAGYTVVFGPTNRDAAALLGADARNAPPGAGRTFVLAPLTLTFHGERGTGEPWSDLSFTFVAADGREFGTAAEDECGAVPNSVWNTGPLEVDRPTAVNACVAVPAELVGEGRWHVAPDGTAFTPTGYGALS